MPRDMAAKEPAPGFEVLVDDPAGSDAGAVPGCVAASNLIGGAARWRQRLASALEAPPDWLFSLLDDGAYAARVTAHRALVQRIEVGPTLVVGFGGSMLGLVAALAVAPCAQTLARDPGRGAMIRVLDSLDAHLVRDRVDWALGCSAQVIFISKSGETVEVLAILDYCLARGLKPAIVISGPGQSALRRRLAAQDRGSCPLDVEICGQTGGRYSVFGEVCSLPLQAAGLAGECMASAARRELQELQATLASGGDSPSLAGLVATLDWRRRHPAPTHILWCYDERLIPWAHWLQQLDCESLSRTHRDLGPYGEFVAVLRGPADQHSVAQHLIDGPRDKRVSIVDFLPARDVADQGVHAVGSVPAQDAAGERRHAAAIETLRAIECESTYAVLPHPRRRVRLDGTQPLASLAVLMVHGMLETVLWAEYLGISPYGQPGVELIKRQVGSLWPPR